MAALTVRTVCIMSISNSCRQASSVSPMSSALTLATTMSMPPKAAAASATQASSAALSATSTARPCAFTPLARSAASGRVDLGRVAGADRDIGALVGEDVGDSAGRCPCCRR